MDSLDSAAAETLRAAAEVFVPSPPYDPTPGCASVDADRFISHYLNIAGPCPAARLAAVLDEVAASDFDGRAFAALDPGERARAMEIAAERDEDAREGCALLGVLSVAAVYGEWTGQDAEGRLVREPLGWTLSGYPGPARAPESGVRWRRDRSL